MDKKGAVKTIKPVAEKCGVRDEELDELFVFESDLFNEYQANLSDKEIEEIIRLSRELTIDYYGRLHLLVSQKVGW
jgi:hypothetical protein